MNVWVGWCTESSTEKAALPEVSSASASTSVRALTLSRPDRGSSSSSVPPPWARRTRSSTATETRRRCPPDSPRICASPMREVALSDSRTVASASATAAARSYSKPRRAERAWRSRCSSTVDVPGGTSSWVMAGGPLALARGGRRAAQQHGALDAAGAPAAGEDGGVDLPAARPDQAIRRRRRSRAAAGSSCREASSTGADATSTPPPPPPCAALVGRRQLRRRRRARRRPRERCELQWRHRRRSQSPSPSASSTPTVWA